MRHIAEPRFLVRFLIFVAVLLVPIGSAQAYVGPGLGAGALAVVVGVVGSVFLAVFAILWYPLKRLLRKRKESGEPEEPQTAK
jgi:hypothetical protein